MERKAKGIWIPIEVWEDKNLSWNEKILFLEIDSYTSKDSDCYISNEYISKLLGVTETSANKILASLISKGYVVKTKFDGRKRYIKTNMVYRKSVLTYEESQPCRLEQPCIAAESNILIQSTNTDTNHKEEIDKSISKKDSDDGSVSDWRSDFMTYLNLVRDAASELKADAEFRALMLKYHPGIDYAKSVDKSVDLFWGTERGWRHKLKSKSKGIDMAATLRKNIEKNLVYIPKDGKGWKSAYEETQKKDDDRLFINGVEYR